MSIRIINRISKFLIRDSFSTTSLRLSSTYKAALIDRSEKDKPFKLAQVKQKKLKKGQVRIKVRSCSFNIWDYSIASGERESTVTTLGYEVSGQVVDATDSDEIAKGDKVVAYSKGTMGGFAQEIVVDEKDCWLKPSTIGSVEACSLIENYATAILGLVKSNHLVEKQNIVVTLASGHGLAPLDIAANVFKAKVLAVCEHEGDESAMLRERGAWSALAYSDKSLKSAVKELTKGQGLPLAYSTMSGDALISLISCMSDGGTVLYSGCDDLPSITAANIISLPMFKIGPISLWSTRNHAFDKYREAVTEALDMCEQNLVSPYVAAKFKLEDINGAYSLFKQKRPMGKVIITMDD